MVIFSKPIKLEAACGHFSAFIKPLTGTAPTTLESGVFPLNVIPKDKGKIVFLDHYNAGSNADKPYLQQTFKGFKEPLSFRDIQVARRVNLKDTIDYIKSLQQQVPKSKL